ncbi:hypothetical protein DNU06_14350 [Putridiphycobacter roseus]|uniref:Secretion system C-terminal sorting domain-containing protein n=1 Tax=Putridiphycobacter roseus TaxID=2219161 RepID=A0A2W1NA26_9FLAO|nr:SdrD B-like domain-containing protein [Putridiphycobacter roseus]PZE16145.1 hypothetical protein DNU06_14350 [Putridiphycobacter roseus]
MKLLNIFYSSIFIFFASISFSQTALTSINQESTIYLRPLTCDSISLSIAPNGLDTVNSADINYSFTGTNLLGINYNLTVTWGDSTVTTHTGSSVSNHTAIIWSPALVNNLSYTGPNAIKIVLSESVSGDSLFKQSLYYSNSCEELNFVANVDCDNDGIIDTLHTFFFPTDLYLYNSTDTIYAQNRTSGVLPLYGFPKILPGTYSIGLNSNLLISSITPSTITFPITGPSPNVTAILNCPYQSCFSGTVFCDDNNNGIYDSLTESPVHNMPVLSGISDTNGFYSTIVGGSWPITTSQYLPMPTSWLAANGYYSANNHYMVDTSYLDSNCVANPPFNIPLNCNLTNADSVCFDGIIFEDLNANGTLDSNENTFTNVPINVNIDGSSQYIFSDTNGYFSYTGVNVGGIDSLIISVFQNWLNNNNFTTNGPIELLNYDCNSNHTTNISLSAPNFNSISTIVSNAGTYNPVCDTVTLSISPIGIDSTINEDIDIYFTGVNILNQQYSVQVNWGDNTTSTHTGTTTLANQAIVWTPALSHAYTIDSVYQIGLTLTKTATQHSKSLNIYYVNSSICPDYFLNINNILDCDGNGNQDATIYNVSSWPNITYNYILHYSSFYLYNATDTIFANACQTYTQMVSWPDSMPAGTYTLGILQSALDSFDLSWLSSIPGNSITMPNNGPIQNITNTFNCVQNQVCLNGYVFCDDNGNGILDGNESTIPNAPIEVNSNVAYSGAINTIDSTDALGYYNFPFTIYDTAYFNVNLDQAWLNTNGYIANNSTFYFDYPSINNSDSILDCNTHFNIPIVCNATAADTICVGGTIFCDQNNNGILDPNESVLPNAPVTITLLNGTGSFTTFTDSLGNYTYQNYHPGMDSVSVNIPSYWLNNNNYNPLSSVTVSLLDCSINTNLGVDCNIPIPCDNTWINIFGSGPYYQNWTNTLALNFGNSNITFPGSIYTISITIPNGSSLDTSSFSITNYTLIGNTLTWTQTINGFDSLLIDFNIDAGIADSTQHNYTATISGLNLDCDSTNNTVNYTAIVGSSYDPNNKLVNLPQYINAGIQEELIYTINFQNTGTAPAQDVRIEDDLSQYLDWNSIQVISKSHNMYYSLDVNGKITFTFPQIWLPDSTSNEPLSKGFVSFKIKENINVPLNVPIENTASIYFDMNPAIVTNTTSNINSVLSSGSTLNSTVLNIYPNPSSGLFHVVSSEMINEIRVFDLSGKQVFYQNDSNNHIQVDLSNLSTGMYVVKITTAGTIINRRIILK